jgi:hypothetical protein
VRWATGTGHGYHFVSLGCRPRQASCEIVALACGLLAWTQMLALTAAARRWEPKRLRLRLAGHWPWVTDITAAAARLQAIPAS